MHKIVIIFNILIWLTYQSQPCEASQSTYSQKAASCAGSKTDPTHPVFCNTVPSYPMYCNLVQTLLINLKGGKLLPAAPLQLCAGVLSGREHDYTAGVFKPL